MALAQCPLGGLANGGEGFRKQVVQGFALRQTLAKTDGLSRQILIAHGGNSGFEGGDALDDLAQRLDVAVVGRSED